MACRPGAFRATAARGLRGEAARKAGRDELLVVWLLVATGILAIFWVPWLIERAPSISVDWGAEEISRAAWWITGPITLLRRAYVWAVGWGSTPLIAGLGALAVLAAWRHPPRQLAGALMMVLAVCLLPSSVKRGDAQRSYFGVYRVMLSLDGQWNTLVHGTTLHGAQRVRDEQGNGVADITPATYYYPQSPMARAVGVVRARVTAEGRSPRFGVIGLGTGSLACLAGEKESWRFFEIDPVVVDIAAKSESFTFLQNCQPTPDIVIGDARLTMAKEKDGSFDLIIVDAFTSDAVPVHLMTAEALEMYLAKLAPGGVALLHISNRYLDLDAVLGATSTIVPGAHGLIVSDDSADGSYAQSSSTIALFSRSADVLEKFRETGTATDLVRETMKPWTDDYSDILAPFLSKYRKRFGR
jgi:SAM-dependent methyltransferase